MTSNVPIPSARHNLYCHPPPIIPQYPINQQNRLNYQPQSIPLPSTHSPFYTFSHILQQPPQPKLAEILEPAKAYLINAHKIGIRAMDIIALSLRNTEDHRTYVKYSKVNLINF